MGFAETGQTWKCSLCTFTCYLGAFLNLSEVSLLTRHSGTIPHLTIMVRSEDTQCLPKASAGWALSKDSSPHYSIDPSRLTASGYQCGKASHFSLTLLLVHGSLPSFPVSPQPLSPGFWWAGFPTCRARPGEICLHGWDPGWAPGGQVKPEARSVPQASAPRKTAGMRHLEMEPGSAGWSAGGWGQERSRGRRTLKDVMWRGSAHIR